LALQKEVLAGNYGYVAARSLCALESLRTKAAQRRALVLKANGPLLRSQKRF